MEGFCITGLGDLYLEGLMHGGLIFGILRYKPTRLSPPIYKP